MLRAGFAILSLLAVSPAFADAKQAQSCAGALAPEPKTIYEASAADVKAGGDVKSVLESKTRSLVMGGKVARSSARSSAEAAGACLKMLNS